MRSTIDLAHNLGLTVVAEGVEDENVLDALVGYGCDAAQGFHFGRPAPAEDLAELLMSSGTPIAGASGGAKRLNRSTRAVASRRPRKGAPRGSGSASVSPGETRTRGLASAAATEADGAPAVRRGLQGQLVSSLISS